ncbi:hypothetical protein D3C72_1745920 [compost metagenome]
MVPVGIEYHHGIEQHGAHDADSRCQGDGHLGPLTGKNAQRNRRECYKIEVGRHRSARCNHGDINRLYRHTNDDAGLYIAEDSPHQHAGDQRTAENIPASGQSQQPGAAQRAEIAKYPDKRRFKPHSSLPPFRLI